VNVRICRIGSVIPGGNTNRGSRRRASIQMAGYRTGDEDMRSYAVTQLPMAGENSFAEAIDAFARREADIMGSAAPTAPS